MESTLILNIFPVGNLSLAVVTTVWLGVWVVAYFNLRLGWVLSGLVVPGYLVPLILVKPWSALIVVFEGILTYVGVWLYSEKLSKILGFTNFFGRDRFFALLLASVVIRVLCDTFLLPSLGEYLNSHFSLGFDYRNNLHSFGLIVVALIANQFWKPGLQRGLVVLFVTVTITFLLVRYLLIPFTNFSVGSLAYMYEDLATSMLAGPKAYIILLTTAFVASHLNLRYGWEYSGILIPALLALEWYQPLKLLATFFETFIILVISNQLLKLPLFRQRTMEGARKLLFFFNVSFFYKLLLGHLVIRFLPAYQLSDFYGFGYLLSTLLAVKMHDKEIAALVTRASVQTSFLSLLLATAIGFSLTFLPNIFSAVEQTAKGPEIISHIKTEGSLMEIVRQDQLLAHRTLRRNSVPVPLPEEMEIFQEALRLLQKRVTNSDDTVRQGVLKLLARLRYTVEEVNMDYLVLTEREPKRGWGTYIINLKPDSDLQLQVVDPFDEWGTSYAGLFLLQKFHGRTLAIAGSRRTVNDNGSADVLTATSSFFSIFQQIFGQGEILQIRGTDHPPATIGADNDGDGTRQLSPHNQSTMMLSERLLQGIELAALEKLVGEFEVVWHPSTAKNRLRLSRKGDFAELFLSRKARRAMLLSPDILIKSPLQEEVTTREINSIGQWLLPRKDQFAASGSEAYIPPRLEELLFWDRELLAPLSHFQAGGKKREAWNEDDRQELRILQNSAAASGYSLLHLQEQDSEEEYLALAEEGPMASRSYRGIFIFRLGQAESYLLQVPRPLFEQNVMEYAASLFQALQGSVLFVSTCHHQANSDGSADVIGQSNKGNFFTLTNQVMLRENPHRKMMVIHCRAFADSDRQDRPDALIATASGIDFSGKQDPLLDRLEEVLRQQYRFEVQDFSGREEDAGYEVGTIPVAGYLDQTEDSAFVNLWLSPAIRKAFRPQADNRPLLHQLSALKIAIIQQDLATFLISAHPPKPAPSVMFIAMREQVKEYIRSSDIVVLQNLLDRWPSVHFIGLLDSRSGQFFLTVLDQEGGTLAVANLQPLRDEVVYLPEHPLQQGSVERYVDTRAMWLIAGDAP